MFIDCVSRVRALRHEGKVCLAFTKRNLID